MLIANRASLQLREDHYSLRTGSAKELTNVKLSDETRRDRIEYAEKREPVDLSPTEQVWPPLNTALHFALCLLQLTHIESSVQGDQKSCLGSE